MCFTSIASAVRIVFVYFQSNQIFESSVKCLAVWCLQLSTNSTFLLCALLFAVPSSSLTEVTFKDECSTVSHLHGQLKVINHVALTGICCHHYWVCFYGGISNSASMLSCFTSTLLSVSHFGRDFFFRISAGTSPEHCSSSATVSAVISLLVLSFFMTICKNVFLRMKYRHTGTTVFSVVIVAVVLRFFVVILINF